MACQRLLTSSHTHTLCNIYLQFSSITNTIDKQISSSFLFRNHFALFLLYTINHINASLFFTTDQHLFPTKRKPIFSYALLRNSLGSQGCLIIPLFNLF